MTARTSDVKVLAKSRSRVPEENTITADGKRICGARKTRGRGICKSKVIMQNGRCKMHGGKALAGALSPSFKNGRYVKDLPVSLQDRWREAMEDPELLSLRKDISLVDAIQTSKLAELRDATENIDLEEISALVNEMARDSMTWDWTRTRWQLERLQDAIGKRTQIERALVEVRDLIDQKADLIAKENRRMHELQQHMSVEEAMNLMRLLIGTLRQACLADGRGQVGREILAEVTNAYRQAVSIREV